MSSIAPNTKHRAMNSKSGCAGLSSRGEHSPVGILRGSKFEQAVESGHANCLKICELQKSNRRLLLLLWSSLLSLKLMKVTLIQQKPSLTMHACCGLTRYWSPGS